MNSQASASVLDDFISKFKPDGQINFDEDDSNDLFEAVARFANKSKPLPTNPDEIDAFLEEIPLFATRMPEAGKESSAFKAVQALMAQSSSNGDGEGTPGTTTEGEAVLDEKTVGKLKDSGNNAYRLAVRLGEEKPNETSADRERRVTARKKKIYEALNHYYTAIDHKGTLVIDENQTQEDADRLLSQIYGNIAASHALLENHGHVVNESKKAIKLNKGNIKAYYRMANSLFKLHKYQQSFVSLQQGLQQCIAVKAAAEYKQFVTLAQKVVLAWKRHDDYERQKVIKAQLAQEEEQKRLDEVEKVLKQRKIIVGKGHFKMETPQQQSGAKMYVGPKKELHFPVIMLYPEVNQSDFLQDVDEYTTMQDLLNLLFPVGGQHAPWDRAKQYNQKDIEVYCYVPKNPEDADKVSVDDSNGVRMAVPLKVGLGHALSTMCKKGYIVPKFPTFCVSLKK